MFKIFYISIVMVSFISIYWYINIYHPSLLTFILSDLLLLTELSIDAHAWGSCILRNTEQRNKQLPLTTVIHYRRLYYIALQVSNVIFLPLNANMHT